MDDLLVEEGHAEKKRANNRGVAVGFEAAESQGQDMGVLKDWIRDTMTMLTRSARATFPVRTSRSD